MVRIGQRLKDARIQRNLTLEEVAIAIKIKQEFLAAIEKGEYGKLPSVAYAQGFVRNYADFLGLPKAETTALFRRDFDEKKIVKVLPDGMVKTREFSLKRLNIRRITILSVLFILLSGFLAFQYRSFFIPPRIDLTSPKAESTVPQDTTVAGITDSDATVIVNNESVAVNNSGEFTKKLTLFPGKTTITIKATNRLGKQTVLERVVTVEE